MKQSEPKRFSDFAIEGNFVGAKEVILPKILNTVRDTLDTLKKDVANKFFTKEES